MACSLAADSVYLSPYVPRLVNFARLLVVSLTSLFLLISLYKNRLTLPDVWLWYSVKNLSEQLGTFYANGIQLTTLTSFLKVFVRPLGFLDFYLLFLTSLICFSAQCM